MIPWKHLTTLDKSIMTIAVMVFGTCTYISFHSFLSPKSSIPKESSIGSIVLQKNDGRYKSSQSFAWQTALETQAIQIDDSIFAGRESMVQVDLKDGSQIVAGENSLVAFNKIQKQDIPNLVQGNFRLRVSGEAKLGIRGKITRIKGDNSQIQIYTGKDLKPRIRLLSGTAQLQLDNDSAPIKIDSTQILEIPAASAEEIADIKPIQIDTLNHNQLLADATFLNKPDEAPPVVQDSSPQPVNIASTEMPRNNKKRRMISSTPEPIPAPVTAAAMPSPIPPPEPVEPESQMEKAESIRLNKKFWAWVGLGMNFNSSDSRIPGVQGASLSDNKNPTLSGRLGLLVHDSYGFELAYNRFSGKVNSGTHVTIQNNSYEWSQINADFIYRSLLLDNAQSEWLWRLGLQHYQIPFIVPVTANTIAVYDNKMTSMAAGFEYRRLLTSNLRLESFFRYHLPLKMTSSADSNFQASKVLSVDGGIGAVYRFRPDWYLGTYLQGQYLEYDFAYSDSSSTYSGDQGIFSSNLDIRVGVEF